MFEVRLLGQVNVVDGGKPFALGGKTQRRVLAALVLRRNEVVSLRYLVDLIWGSSEPPDRAEHNVRTYVHRLRTALGDQGERIETVAGGYRLRLASEELDLARYEEAAGTAARLAKTGESIAALDLIDQAATWWLGRPLEEFEDEQWAQPDAERLGQVSLAMRTLQARQLLLVGKPNDAVTVLEALIQEAPLREEPRSLLMRALYESGRHVEALRAFQDFRTYLGEEIGLEPSAALFELDR